MVELLNHLRGVEQKLADQVPFDELIAAIDAAHGLPGAEQMRSSIERHRVRAYVTYRRPADECSAVLDAFLAIEPDLAPRAMAVLAACGQIPALAPRYLDTVIAELEAAAPADAVAENALQDAYQLRRRLRGERPLVIANRVLTVDGDPGRTVRVRIYEPEPDRASGTDWRCNFRVQGAVTVQEHGNGTDSLQALINALQGVRKILDDSGLSLTWAGGEPGDHGVPGKDTARAGG